LGAAVVCVLVGALVVANVGSARQAGHGAVATHTASSLTIGVDYPRSDTDFWNSYISYVPKFATSMGVKLITTNSENDISKLAANVQTLMSRNVNGVVIAPQDTAAVVPTLNQLQAKHIPAVSIDTRPDAGSVAMVVRANNKDYGTKACQVLGTSLKGQGKVVMLEGDLASINGRDRTTAFNACMKKDFPHIKVFGEPSKWDAATAASQLAAVVGANPDVRGVYMESSFALAGTLQVLRQHGMLHPGKSPKHVFIVSNDGIPQELKDIGGGLIDATVSQPADLYAKYGLYYAVAAAQGKTFKPGKTNHNSTIIRVRAGLLEDELQAPLVTRTGAPVGGIPTVKYTSKTLWGNNLK
jgi:simple sugar transport system substrate-binding protein/ribose transport system substrate-binding protein